MITVPKLKNVVLEATEESDIFSQVFTFLELKEAGVQFKNINDKGKGKFIIAKFGDDVQSIPCGKSITDDHTTHDCSFGVAKDDVLVAFIPGSGSWL